METKETPQYIKAIEGRKATGIFAVHGNIDSVGDRSWPGAFAKTINDRGLRGFKFLWQHDFEAPPIATILEVREVPREQLPEQVLAAAPEALGGALVTREYLDTPRGNEILAGLKAGAITEMSYGYDPVKFDYEDLAERGMVRNLREVKLYDISDVLWGANGATSAVKSRVPLEAILKHMQAHLAELKAGSRHSAKDVALLNAIHGAAVDLGCTTCKGLADEAETETDGKQGPDLDVLFKARLSLLQFG